jgi:hypothetical protein
MFSFLITSMILIHFCIPLIIIATEAEFDVVRSPVLAVVKSCAGISIMQNEYLGPLKIDP